MRPVKPYLDKKELELIIKSISEDCFLSEVNGGIIYYNVFLELKGEYYNKKFDRFLEKKTFEVLAVLFPERKQVCYKDIFERETIDANHPSISVMNQIREHEYFQRFEELKPFDKDNSPRQNYYFRELKTD